MRHPVAGALDTMSTTDVSCSEQFDDIALFHPFVVFINFRSEIQNNLQTRHFDRFSIESTQTSECIDENVIFSPRFTEGLRSWNNWKGITLLSISGKVFNRILLERMKTEVDRLLREEQAGYRKERSCTDHIATLRVIIEQSLEGNSPLYITFIDFEKSFDSVDRTALWSYLHITVSRKRSSD